MIVVTGAAGFIGSNVVAALNARGRPDIVAVDSFRHTAKDTRYLHELRIHDTVDKDRLARWLDEEVGRGVTSANKTRRRPVPPPGGTASCFCPGPPPGGWGK